jgi:hypothetical protein
MKVSRQGNRKIEYFPKDYVEAAYHAKQQCPLWQAKAEERKRLYWEHERAMRLMRVPPHHSGEDGDEE